MPGPLAAEPRVAGDPELLRRATLMLSEARRPFVVAGSGAFYAGAGEALKSFVEATQIPVLSHLWDRGCVESAWPQYVGIASGEVNGAFRLLSQADVALFLGARLDYRVNHGLPPVIAGSARIIRIDAEPSEIHRPRPADLGIVADPKSALEGMAAHLPGLPFPHADWLARARSARESFLRQWDGKGEEEGCPISALRICRELQPFLDREVTFLLDGGNIGRWAHMMLWNRHPSHWLTCGASGAVGWGLSGAVAARLSRPDHPVLLLTGDGAAGFTLADIETALRFKTPYVAVVAHDAAWGVVADHRPDDYKDATLLGEIRFDRVAAALGARGVFIEKAARLGPAIEEGLQADTVTFIHVPTQLGGIAQWARKWRL